MSIYCIMSRERMSAPQIRIMVAFFVRAFFHVIFCKSIIGQTDSDILAQSTTMEGHPLPKFPNINIRACTTDRLRNELSSFLLSAWCKSFALFSLHSNLLTFIYDLSSDHTWPLSPHMPSPPWSDMSAHPADYIDTTLLLRSLPLTNPANMDDKSVLMFCMHLTLLRASAAEGITTAPGFGRDFRFKSKYDIFVAQLARGVYRTVNAGGRSDSVESGTNSVSSSATLVYNLSPSTSYTVHSIDAVSQVFPQGNRVRYHADDSMTIDEEVNFSKVD